VCFLGTLRVMLPYKDAKGWAVEIDTRIKSRLFV
jgi:hypothetical protein